MSERSSSKSSTTVPFLNGNIGFNAQHSPMGAFMSFTCGNFGSGGGIGVEIGRPADQKLFIGVKHGDRKAPSPIVCLPFIEAATATAGGGSAADYQVGQAGTTPPATGLQVYFADQISRKYGWATDTWTTPDFTFSVHSPFGAIPEPSAANVDAMRTALLPAVVATMRVDNKNGKTTKTAVFAMNFMKAGARVFDAGDDADTPGRQGTVGFGWRRTLGVLARADTDHGDSCEPFALQRWSIAEAVAADYPVHALGTCAGVAVEVPAGRSVTLVLAMGAYLDGVVTTGLEGKYLYTRYFTNLDDVLTTALERADDLQTRAARLDGRLAGSPLSVDQQFLIAHATRSYYGSTQLLDVGGEPFWVVNEGEYCMMNTLDLSVDQVFWELDCNPWVVRNLLDNFSRRYSYVDEVQGPGGKLQPGGLSFTHDMGVNNNFSPAGYSSYEISKLTGCFSHMTAEQLCNWSLMAACYVARTGDRDWLRRSAPQLRACLESLVNRGGEVGFTQYDSSRCEGGQEITTYDSLDHSLAQTRNNVYMAVKCWASYVGLAQLFDMLGDAGALAKIARDRVARISKEVIRHAGADGVLPAVFETSNPGHAARILPAVEGLMYPLYWERTGFPSALRDATAGSPGLVEALRKHTLALLNDPERGNLFVDGGIRLSSTSDNSWMSKIAIFQHVARELFGVRDDAKLRDLFAKADTVHVRWQTVGSAYWACCDQIVNGEAKGSRYYPRIITTALWLDEPGRSRDVAAKSVGQAFQSVSQPGV